jgi:ferredoxin
MADFEERTIHGWTARIDRHLCVGFGDCIDAAPAAFVLDDDGIAVFTETLHEAPPEALESACRSCPVDAITLHDGAGRLVAP